MPCGYQHLTSDQRNQIYALNASGQSPSKMAAIVGCSARTIQRELKRNRGLRGYRPRQAQCMANARKHRSKPYLLKLKPWLKVLIAEKLALQWSQLLHFFWTNLRLAALW
jgi:IS30 family transposase